MRNFLICLMICLRPVLLVAQVPVDFRSFDKNGDVQAALNNHLLRVEWPVGEGKWGKVEIDLRKAEPLCCEWCFYANRVA
jgi:hypothetical protein